MGNGGNKDADLDVLALLHEVHGTEAGNRGAAVEQALRTLEATHRRASLAMQTFERDGNPQARRSAAPRAPLAESPASAPGAPPAAARAAPPPTSGVETTAIWRPDDAPTPGLAPALPTPASREATEVGRPPDNARRQGPDGASPPPAADVYAGRGADWSLRERTRTQRIVRPKKDG